MRAYYTHKTICASYKIFFYTNLLRKNFNFFTIFNTVNKSECIKHVVFECALNVLSWNVALSLLKNLSLRKNFIFLPLRSHAFYTHIF